MEDIFDSKKLEKVAQKMPDFVTTLDANGNEKLELYKGKPVSGECIEYKTFVEKFIAPFAEIRPMQIKDILDKQIKKEL